jgi:hypothetical protein
MRGAHHRHFSTAWIANARSAIANASKRAAPKTVSHGGAHEVRHRVAADASAARIVAVEPKGDAHRRPFAWSPQAIEKLMSPRPDRRNA